MKRMRESLQNRRLQWFGHLEKYKRVLSLVNAGSSRLVVVFPMVNLGKNEMG